MSKKNQIDWMRAIHITKYKNINNKTLNLTKYFKRIIRKAGLFDVPCYIDKQAFDGIGNWNLNCHIDTETDIGIIQAKSIMLDKFYPQNVELLLHLGSSEVIKVLLPLLDNPNVPDSNGKTPIWTQAYYGGVEAIKLLAPLTETPNACNNENYTPIAMAALMGHINVINILAPISDNPNADFKSSRGMKKPSIIAKVQGHHEIARILLSYES